MFSCNQAVQAIENWKAHQLRSHRQDKARLDIIDLLKEDTSGGSSVGENKL